MTAQTLQNEPEAPVKITPMMQQYLAVKNENQDSLLFYRMGDFYELFFDDAVVAAKVLDIALTHRGKHEDERIPMCGVPHHSYEPYLHKLINAGYKVAVCEQMESPEEAKKRGYKAVVRREVVRVVTPGTLIEDNLLNAREANYLAAIAVVSGKMAIAWIDISTGEFAVCPTSNNALPSDIVRLNAKEIIVPDKLFEDNNLREVFKSCTGRISPQVNNLFDVTRSENKIKSFYGVSSLDSYGDFARAEIAACGALIEYVDLTQRGNLPRLNHPKRLSADNFMVIDAATRRNLEINTTLSGDRRGSLISVIDKTITGAGARLLAQFISSPLRHSSAINSRLDRVQYFVQNENLRNSLREILKQIPDLERALSRVCIGKGGPKDLIALREGLRHAMSIADLMENQTDSPFKTEEFNIVSHDELVVKLQEALQDEVGILARDGGFVAEGYHPRLDELRDLALNGRNKMLEMRDRYRQETGVSALKIVQNNVLGYFVEVTPSHSGKIVDEKFIHRQTLAGAVRYTTEELRRLESDILNAKDQALKLELAIFNELVALITSYSEKVAFTAHIIAQLDVASALAELAAQNNYSRPHVDDSNNFKIEGGRHPVVEKNIEEDFIANDCDLSDSHRLWLLTGPNMAGKSTFLRQNAIITLLAQIGSYVPAEIANIGTVDKLFSRVGASDDLARGRSTFMVEMVETATIINQATERSLVILDEIGRGTATYDGLSIAWAVVENLHNVNKCRALFATHYHELTTLSSKLPALVCYSMKVKEWEGKVIFLHEVQKGAADRSYGIHVAKLAGLPDNVIKRADQILKILQESELGSARLQLVDDLPLFSYNYNANGSKVAIPANSNTSAIENELKQVDIDNISPRDALDFLYKLRGMV